MPDDAATPSAIVPLADYADPALWAAPWPDEPLSRDGAFDLSAFPNPRGIAMIEQTVALLANAPGFPITSTIFFPMSGALDPASLPDVHASLDEGASIYVVDVGDGPHRGERHPIAVSF